MVIGGRVGAAAVGEGVEVCEQALGPLRGFFLLLLSFSLFFSLPVAQESLEVALGQIRVQLQRAVDGCNARVAVKSSGNC